MEEKKETMRLAIVGSRSFKDRDRLFAQLDKIKDIELIISGGAMGADSFAQEYAKKKGINIMIFYPRWNLPDGTRDRGAGYRRNIDIMKMATHAIIVWDGKSRGTKHDVELAKRMKIKTKIIMFEPETVADLEHDDRGDN